MSEPTTTDVEQYTRGRLPGDDPETERLLTTALAAARRWCGWHVTPVVEDETVTLDGPGTIELFLPTLALGSLTAISEDGVEVDLDDLEVSAMGLVRKKSRLPWTSRYGAIEATMTHGYPDAPDFNAAVLAAVSASASSVTQGNLTRQRIDDVEYQWASPSEALPTAMLAPFKLERRP